MLGKFFRKSLANLKHAGDISNEPYYYVKVTELSEPEKDILYGKL